MNKEIKDFAKELVELTDREVEIWVKHALVPQGNCCCTSCRKHAIYNHIVEALERWEARKVASHPQSP